MLPSTGINLPNKLRLNEAAQYSTEPSVKKKFYGGGTVVSPKLVFNYAAPPKQTPRLMQLPIQD